MLRSGLSSVSYRNLNAPVIIAAAKKVGLRGIEWTADTHAPHGDLATAEKLMMATLRAGLTVSAYGSFYRIGLGARRSVDFSTVLAGALRLQAPVVRVWAAPPSENGKVDMDALTDEASFVADEAGRHGITICLEPHEKSVVDDYGLLADIVSKVNHPFFKACWAPLPAKDPAERCRAAELMGPFTALIHVRNWTRSYDRRSLNEGFDGFKQIVAALSSNAAKSSLDYWTLIEYLEDDEPATLERETKALTELLASVRV